jgi:hypothetical protein
MSPGGRISGAFGSLERVAALMDVSWKNSLFDQMRSTRMICDSYRLIAGCYFLDMINYWAREMRSVECRMACSVIEIGWTCKDTRSL